MKAVVLLIAFVLAVLGGCAPRLQAPGPDAADPRAPTLAEGTLRMPDGTELPLRRWLPDGPPRAAILALHGFNDYSNAFDGIGNWLAGQGVAVYAYDQRGFGAAPQTGRWPGSDALIADARAALAVLRAAHPGIPLHALGESMGGAVLVAGEAAAPFDADGLILVAPAVWGRETMPFYQIASLWLFAHSFPWLTLSPKGIERHPSDNIPMLRALGRDPLVIKRTRIDAIWGVVDLMDRALAAAPSLEARTLILLGQHDDIIPAPAVTEMLERLPTEPRAPRTVALYRSGYHMLLRDLKAELVWADILSWITRPGAVLPSGADRIDAEEILADAP